MKKFLGLLLVVTILFVGCSETTETGETKVDEAVSFSFGEDLVFIENGHNFVIDLDESSDLVIEKHEELSGILTADVLDDIVATTTTTANILEDAGVIPVGAPESMSLSSTLTEMQYKVGEEDSGVLNIGSALSPNIEAIIELNPSLVLYSSAMPKADYVSSLMDAGLDVHTLNQDDYIDMFVLLDVINSVTNYENDTANDMMNEQVNLLKAVASKVESGDESHTVAILQVLEGSTRVNNSETVLGSVVSSLGMENVFATSENAELNNEALLEANPDFIIYYTHGMGADTLASFEEGLDSDDSLYRELDAYKNDQMFHVAGDDFKFAASVDFDIVKIIEFLASKFYE